MTLCVGLTGGIASGKSFVGDCFAGFGVPVLDADQVAREVVAPGTAGLAAIVESFGVGVLTADKQLDRPAMRRRVFNDRAALHQLERITHPLIRARVTAWRQRQTTPYCLYSAAILLEAGMDSLVDRVLVVDVPEAVQISRLMARDRHDEPLARQIMAAQAPRERRLAGADDIVDNGDGDARILPQLQRLHRLYTALGASRHGP